MKDTRKVGWAVVYTISAMKAALRSAIDILAHAKAPMVSAIAIFNFCSLDKATSGSTCSDLYCAGQL